MSFRSRMLQLSLLALLSATAAHANSTTQVRDKEITHDVERLISAQPTLGSLLTVQTKSGVVFIGGTPGTRFGISNLELLVRQTDGVEKVVVTAVYPEN